MTWAHTENIKHTPSHTLVILELADDLYVFAFLSQHCSDSVYVGCFADEGGEDHVYSVLHAELQVLDVFFGNSRQVYGSTGEVHSLLAAQGATVLDLAHQEIRTWRRKNARMGWCHSSGLKHDQCPYPLQDSPISLTCREMSPSSM